jgi:pyruvate ferredoxin oxidoreductase gamma subunit
MFLAAFSVMMIEIRFHGRGGQGAKIASRIVGRAGFLAGLFAQDFPLFGAERRGAPVTATTRLSREPIERRGFAEEPDLVVVMDPSLLTESQRQIFSGIYPGTPVLVNIQGNEDLLISGHQPVICIPATTIARRVIGEPVISAVLAGAAARFVPEVTAEVLAQAITMELKELTLPRELVTANITAAQMAFSALPSFFFSDLKPARAPGRLPSEGAGAILPVPVGASIEQVGNARLRHTGNWRTERPVIDQSKCKRCFLCYLYCPDGAIALDDQNYPHIDYEYCKGCLICYDECPPQAISFAVEEQGHGA